MEVTAQYVERPPVSYRNVIVDVEEDDEPRFGAIIRDVSKRRARDERLHHLAHYDQLTLLTKPYVVSWRSSRPHFRRSSRSP